MDMKKDGLNYEQEEELQKSVIALLLSGDDKPISSKINFQKELFILVNSFPKFKELFDFKSHMYGPYSNNAETIIESHIDLFDIDQKGLQLTNEGKKYSEHAKRELNPSNRELLLKNIHLIRKIYDKLNDQEFMFLIYNTYGYTDKSDVFFDLMRDKERIAKSLYRKGVITYKKYIELLNSGPGE